MVLKIGMEQAIRRRWNDPKAKIRFDSGKGVSICRLFFIVPKKGEWILEMPLNYSTAERHGSPYQKSARILELLFGDCGK